MDSIYFGVFSLFICVSTFSLLIRYKARKIYLLLLGFLVAYLSIWGIPVFSNKIQMDSSYFKVLHATLIWGLYWLLLEYFREVFHVERVYVKIRKRSLIPFFLHIMVSQIYIISGFRFILLILQGSIIVSFIYMLCHYSMEIYKKKLERRKFTFYFLVLHSFSSLLFFTLIQVFNKPYYLYIFMNGILFLLFCFFQLGIEIREDLAKQFQGSDNTGERWKVPTDSYGLSELERRILQYILDGSEDHSIRKKLKLSSDALQKHISSIYLKCNISKRMDLFILFQDRNITKVN